MSSFLSSVFGCGSDLPAPRRPPPIRSIKQTFASPAPPRGLTPVGPYPHSRKPSNAAHVSAMNNYNDIPVYPFQCPNSNRHAPLPQRPSEPLSNCWSGGIDRSELSADRPDWVTFPAQFPSARDRFGLINPRCAAPKPPLVSVPSMPEATMAKISPTMFSFGTQTLIDGLAEAISPPRAECDPSAKIKPAYVLLPKSVEVALQVECRPRPRRELTVSRKAVVDVESVSTSGDAEGEIVLKSEQPPPSEPSWPSSPPRPVGDGEEKVRKGRRQLVNHLVDVIDPVQTSAPQPTRLVMHTLSALPPIEQIPPTSPPNRLSALCLDLSTPIVPAKFTTHDLGNLIDRLPEPATLPRPPTCPAKEFQMSPLVLTTLSPIKQPVNHADAGALVYSSRHPERNSCDERKLPAEYSLQTSPHCVCQKCPARLAELENLQASLSAARKSSLMSTPVCPSADRAFESSYSKQVAHPAPNEVKIPELNLKTPPTETLLRTTSDEPTTKPDKRHTHQGVLDSRPTSAPKARAQTAGASNVGQMVALWEKRSSPLKSARLQPDESESNAVPSMQLVTKMRMAQTESGSIVGDCQEAEKLKVTSELHAGSSSDSSGQAAPTAAETTSSLVGGD